MKKKKNCRLILGLVIGIAISITSVYAATYYGAASGLSYDNTTSGLSSSDVQGALDELYEIKSNPCPDGYTCELSAPLQPGDYVSYTPTLTEYTTDTTRTGYTSTQTINPSELNLWRVLSINEDGTIDIISEYVSSTAVYFSGQTGYLYFVGYLNELASKYETDGITVGSRHFGYDGQTEFITDTSKITSTSAPWSATTIDNSNERVGGGDTLYLTDYDLVNTVLGTRVAYKVSATTTATTYWMSSRYYNYDSSNYWYFKGSYVYTSGSNASLNLYHYDRGSFYTTNASVSLRPIVTLKSGLQYTGAGTSGSPWTITS